MERATAAPPATASEPPSQKSFCTSTMMSACTRSLCGGMAPCLGFFAVAAEDRRDRRVPTGQLEGVGGEFGERRLVPLACLGERLAADDLAVLDEFLQQHAVGRPEVRRRSQQDPLGHRLAAGRAFPYGPLAAAAPWLPHGSLGDRLQHRVVDDFLVGDWFGGPGHELVDERRRRGPGPGDQRGPY